MDEKIDDTLARKRRKSRKGGSTDFTGSKAEALSRSPKDVLALGQVIVRELELDARGEVLQRWLAHHLAELISEAESAAGPEKAAAEQQAVDLILKLWMHRRALPAAVDPLGGYREAIAVLGRLVPDADPWRRYRRHGSYEDLLHEMFEILCRIVAGGLLLTHFAPARPISEAESRALEDEEVFLHTELEQWMKFLALPPQPPEIEVEFVDTDTEDDEGDQDDVSEADSDNPKSEQHAANAGWSVHSAIAANLERIQDDLTDLLTRWRRVAPDEPRLDENVDGDSGDDD